MNEKWQINNLISWKFLLKNPEVNPKKQFAYNTNWILDPFTQVKSAERMAKKNQFQMHIFWFFLSRQCQNVGNVHETFINTKIPFKRRTFLEQKVPYVSSETSLPRLVQNKPSALIPAKKTRLNSSKHNFMVKSSRLSTKRIGAFFWTFSFHLCLSSAYFQT